MTHQIGGSMSDEKMEAIQAVVDRVAAYQDGAPEGTVATELRAGLAEAGVDVGDEAVEKLAAAIESEHGSISAASILG